MNCKKVTSLLVDYFENTLGAQEKKMMEDHLRVCPNCREELKEIESLFETLKLEKTEKMDHTFWTNFVPEIRRGIDKASPTRSKWNLIPQLGPLFGFVIAILLVGIILFSRDYGFHGQGVSVSETTQTYTIYEYENTTEQLAEILTLTGETEGVEDLLSSDDKQSILALEEIIDDQYWEKTEWEDLLDDLSSEELNLLEEKIENIII